MARKHDICKCVWFVVSSSASVLTGSDQCFSKQANGFIPQKLILIKTWHPVYAAHMFITRLILDSNLVSAENEKGTL